MTSRTTTHMPVQNSILLLCPNNSLTVVQTDGDISNNNTAVKRLIAQVSGLSIVRAAATANQNVAINSARKETRIAAAMFSPQANAEQRNAKPADSKPK